MGNNPILAVSAILVCAVRLAGGRGLLLLYRPKDISNDCVFSQELRYDLSFGNGLSDTISLVFRTLNEIDYECGVEIVTDSNNVFLLVVIRFPNNIGTNCPINQDAFTVLKKNRCIRICDFIGNRDLTSPYFIIPVRGRIRFQFLSNSSINSDMDANLYQVTATSARQKPRKGCNLRNESICVIEDTEYCFTSGVVCDGIKNCGVADWYDERKSDCESPVERMGLAPVAAVVALALFLTLAGAHLLLRCLPPLADSFFIFNANEDNRLCIDPVFQAPDYAPYDNNAVKRLSIIPVPSSSSEEEKAEDNDMSEPVESELLPIPKKYESPEEMKIEEVRQSEEEVQPVPRRKVTMRTLTDILQERLRAVTGSRRSGEAPDVLELKNFN